MTSAEFDQSSAKWTVKTADERTAKTRFLIVAAGFAAKRYIPAYKGVDKYMKIMHHSSFWLPNDVDIKGSVLLLLVSNLAHGNLPNRF